MSGRTHFQPLLLGGLTSRGRKWVPTNLQFPASPLDAASAVEPESESQCLWYNECWDSLSTSPIEAATRRKAENGSQWNSAPTVEAERAPIIMTSLYEWVMCREMTYYSYLCHGAFIYRQGYFKTCFFGFEYSIRQAKKHQRMFLVTMSHMWVFDFAVTESWHTCGWGSTRECVSGTYQRQNEGAETKWLPCGLVSTRSVLQCVAVCYRVLQCAAVCYSVLQCVKVRCSMLQCGAVCCSDLEWRSRDDITPMSSCLVHLCKRVWYLHKRAPFLCKRAL